MHVNIRDAVEQLGFNEVKSTVTILVMMIIIILGVIRVSVSQYVRYDYSTYVVLVVDVWSFLLE